MHRATTNTLQHFLRHSPVRRADAKLVQTVDEGLDAREADALAIADPHFLGVAERSYDSTNPDMPPYTYYQLVWKSEEDNLLISIELRTCLERNETTMRELDITPLDAAKHEEGILALRAMLRTEKVNYYVPNHENGHIDSQTSKQAIPENGIRIPLRSYLGFLSVLPASLTLSIEREMERYKVIRPDLHAPSTGQAR